MSNERPFFPRPPADDAHLLRQCEVQVFRASGPGGQHVNTTNTAVRLRHVPSGVTVVCGRERSQAMNRRICLKRLREKLERLAFRPRRRIPTRMSRGARSRIRQAKSKRSKIKRLRRPPSRDE